MKKQAVIISAVIVLLNACFLTSALSQITNEVIFSKNDQSVKAGEWEYYEIDVPSEATQLNIGLTNLSGDVDLYVKKEAEPRFGDYDYTSRKYRNKPETCKLYDNLPGKWFIGVYGYKGGNFDITVVAHQVKTPENPDPEDETFTFAIFGDKTDVDDMSMSNAVLEKAVKGVNNRIAPEFVFTVGDLIQGEDHAGWICEKDSYQKIMNGLNCQWWYPVVGNHDVYGTEGRGKTKPFKKPYEKFFGPLWYAFEYKKCWFIALSVVNKHQEMGEKQKEWLVNFLDNLDNLCKDEVRKPNHIFLFQHVPRWWKNPEKFLEKWWLHKELRKLTQEHGISCTVFAGHTHTPRKFDKYPDMRYYTLGITGGFKPKKKSVDHSFWTVEVKGKCLEVWRYSVSDDKDFNRINNAKWDGCGFKWGEKWDVEKAWD